MKILKEEVIAYPIRNHFITKKYDKTGKIIFKEIANDLIDYEKHEYYYNEEDTIKSEISEYIQNNIGHRILNKYEYHSNGYRIFSYLIAEFNKINDSIQAVEDYGKWINCNDFLGLEDIEIKNNQKTKSITYRIDKESKLVTQSEKNYENELDEKIIENKDGKIIHYINSKGIIEKILRYNKNGLLTEKIDNVDIPNQISKSTFNWYSKFNITIKVENSENSIINGDIVTKHKSKILRFYNQNNRIVKLVKYEDNLTKTSIWYNDFNKVSKEIWFEYSNPKVKVKTEYFYEYGFDQDINEYILELEICYEYDEDNNKVREYTKKRYYH